LETCQISDIDLFLRRSALKEWGVDLIGHLPAIASGNYLFDL
jgi:hypothetical protein